MSTKKTTNKTEELEKHFLTAQILFLLEKDIQLLPHDMHFEEYFAAKKKNKFSENFPNKEGSAVRAERIIAEIQAAISKDAFEELPKLEEAERLLEKHQNDFNNDEPYLFSMISIWTYLAMIRFGLTPTIKMKDNGEPENTEERLKRMLNEFSAFNKYNNMIIEERENFNRKEIKVK